MTELQTKKAKSPLKIESSLQYGIVIPGDKSMSHRAVMLSAISRSEIDINGLLESEDVKATIEAFQAMGIKIEIEKEESYCRVYGQGLHGLKKPTQVLNMGNSGTSARLLMGVLAGQDFETIMDGDDSLRKRPMKRVTAPLSQMGAKFEFLEKDGCLPIKITGNPNLEPLKDYKMPVASAQIKSAILLAGLYAEGETSIIEKEPSRDHTERMLNEFGVSVKKEKETIKLTPKEFLSYDDDLHVHSDPSSAAFFITAGLLVKDSEIIFSGMSLNETRTGFVDVVKEKLNCKVEIEDEGYALEGEPFAMDTTINYTKIKPKTYIIPPEYAPRMIDEYPILAVLAAGSNINIRMEGIGELRVKESDRIAVMEEGLKACGVDVESGDDWMIVYGSSTGKVKGGAKIKTHLDHRIAMSFIILGLIAENPITIDDISPIMTSFPSFFDELKKLGVDYGF